MGFVSTTVKDTLKEALIRFAKKHEATPTDMCLKITWKEKEELTTIVDDKEVKKTIDEHVHYYIQKNYKTVEEPTFKQVANIGKIDLLAREALATPILEKSLKYFAEKHETKPENICFLICTGDKHFEENKLQLQCFIYKENKPLNRKRRNENKQEVTDCKITVEEILGEEDIETIN